jgi:hypothetical protein
VGRFLTLWLICGFISAGMLLNSTAFKDEPVGAVVMGLLYGPIALGSMLAKE